jgi:hypothetical protein
MFYMLGIDKDHDSRRPGAYERGWSSTDQYSRVGRSGGRVTMCVIYTVHKETRSVSFLVWPQNQGRHVSQFGPQNQQLRFGDFRLKITATISWFESQKTRIEI